MAAFADRPCSTLAYGDVKRVELAIALASRPKLLLMDEPTAGMAPRERAALMELTATIARERRIGVLFTEHDMGAVFAHADRILVLVRGEIIAAGIAGGGAGECARARGLSRRQRRRRRARPPGPGVSALLEVEGLSAFYGRAQILFDVALALDAGEVAVADGPQRRRQDHDLEGDHGPRRRPRRPPRLRRPLDQRACELS